MRFRARLAVFPRSEASSKRQGDGQRFQKKAMKTINHNEASAPANVRPSSVSNTSKTVQTEFVRHCPNRRLSTETILNYLRTRLPRQYEVAEVVGKWVWLDVSPARNPGLASVLFRAWSESPVLGVISGLRYRRLAPAWWRFMRVRNQGGLREAVGGSWKQLS